MTTKRGRLKIFANYKLFTLIDLLEVLADKTHRAYSGKNEHKLETSCFYPFLCPPTSINDNNLVALSNHFYQDIIEF